MICSIDLFVYQYLIRGKKVSGVTSKTNQNKLKLSFK